MAVLPVTELLLRVEFGEYDSIIRECRMVDVLCIAAKSEICGGKHNLIVDF